MDYFDDVFHTILGLDSVIYLAVNGTVISIQIFIQNILNCVPKTNKAFTGLEQQVINDNIFILGRGNPLTINLVVCSNYISRSVHHTYGWRMHLMETYIGHTSYQK